MAKIPYFSVIIPCLNEKVYLPKLLTSLVKQKYRSFEVILADGKSDDTSREIFAKYIKRLPAARLVISNKRNVGYQRNLGAKSARGEYLVFLDADCQVRPYFLQKLHKLQQKHPIEFASTWIAPDSRRASEKLLLDVGNFAQELTHKLHIPMGCGYNMMIRRKTFLRLRGFRSKVLYNEDLDFSLKALRKNVKLKLLKEPKVVYSMRRFRSEGMLNLLPKMIMGQIYMFLVGPITSDIFRYYMGGHVHNEHVNTKRKRWALALYQKTVGKIERKVMEIIE